MKMEVLIDLNGVIICYAKKFCSINGRVYF